MIFSSESNDEKIKLVVVQSSFTDVIQAMYSNEKHQQSEEDPGSSPSFPD